MKAYLWLPLACLIGYLAGSWGAQDELRSFRAHARDSREKATASQGGFDTFARMVKIPETARRSRRPRLGKGPSAASPISPSAATNGVAAKAPYDIKKDAQAATDADVAKLASPESSATNAPPVRLSPEDLRARIEEAQELWRTRVDVARAQWKSKLKLDAEGEKAFGAALQEMNERLYDSVAALAGLLAEKPSMTPELGLRLVGETTTILSETYDKVGACAPADKREIISTMQMGDFIDPGVAEPLVEVQGKLNGMALWGKRGK